MTMTRRLCRVLPLAVPLLSSGAQDYTHPRVMNLPAPSFRRPDPAPLQGRLPNGLVVYVVEDRTVPLATLSAVVRAGSGDETIPGQIESLTQSLRSGPATLSPGEFQRALAEMTAEFQVSVGPDLTTITLNVPVEDLERALSLFAGLLRQPRVVAAPAAGRASALTDGSMPGAVLLFEELVYRGRPYGGPPPSASDARATLADVEAFHRRYFVPGNVVVAVAGDVSTADVRERLRVALGAWRGSAAPSRGPLPASGIQPSAAGRVIHTYDVDKLQGWLVMGHELPVPPVADEAPLAVMNYIMAGDHLGGRMFIEARDRRGLTNDEIGHPEPRLRGPGTYTIRAAGRPESITQLIDIGLREAERIRTTLVTGEELAIAKGALADGEFAYQFRNGHSTALTLAREWAMYGDHRRSATLPERTRAVTAADVQAMARKYLAPERMHIVLLGPIAAIREATAKGNHPPLEQFGVVRSGR
ncbi:MAG: insulinase family protein [Gemmatimonadaceae bacterium]|nr:insulinase family protein [Gemmatimonadaceae bacterium]